MKNQIITILLTMILSMTGATAFAHDIEVKNDDGVTIYYNYTNDGTELSVTYRGISYNHYNNEYTGTLVIPEEVTYMNRTRKVTSIGYNAFSECSRLITVTIPNSVTSIGQCAFYKCSGLTSITIPNSVTGIGEDAFYNCSRLTSVHISDIAAWCKIPFSSFNTNPLFYAHHLYLGEEEITDLVIPKSVTSIDDFAFCGYSSLISITIPNSVTSIGEEAFYNCSGLTSITIPNSVKSIGLYAFSDCSGLTSITIPNSVTSIGNRAFAFCNGLTSITIGNSVTRIGHEAFYGCNNLTVIISLIMFPFNINTNTFEQDVFYNSTLYVPIGTIDKYKAATGWNKFLFIEEGTGSGGGETPTPHKCAKPTISYSNGKLTFSSETEGAVCQSTITDSDINSYSSNEVQLTVTYNISVYAKKDGYENSDVVTATLCWIDQEPRKEGIENGVREVSARALLIKSDGGRLTIDGAADSEQVDVYDVKGNHQGQAISHNGQATVSTHMKEGSIAIVKIGERAVKVMVQ